MSFSVLMIIIALAFILIFVYSLYDKVEALEKQVKELEYGYNALGERIKRRQDES